MSLFDAQELLDLQKTAAGFVVSKARLARSGIQNYLAGDPGLGGLFSDLDPTSQVRIYRPADEVFSPEAMASYAGIPITIEHRGGFVTPENAQSLIVGWVGDAIWRDGDLVSGTIRVVHRSGIDALEMGIKELSVGYECEIHAEPGMTPAGEAYDGIQTMIRANHVSLVSKGRCGPTCTMDSRMHDAGDCTGTCAGCQEKKRMPKVIDVNGISIEISDQAAQAFDALRTSHANSIETKDTEIATSAARVKDLETKLAKCEAKAEAAEKGLKDAESKLTPEALDAAARERATLLEDAKILAPKLATATLDAIGIRREALKAAGVVVDGKSDDYATAAFDARVEIARSNGGTSAKGADSLAHRTQANDSGDARSKYLARMSDAYKTQEASQ